MQMPTNVEVSTLEEGTNTRTGAIVAPRFPAVVPERKDGDFSLADGSSVLFAF
jgi:hypothetical protein